LEVVFEGDVGLGALVLLGEVGAVAEVWVPVEESVQLCSCFDD
jgi:hypothetical protein